MPMPRDNMYFGLRETMTREQMEYVNSIFDNRLTIVNAKAGTGKTTLAVGAAKILGMKLVYVFAPVQEDMMGFRPGSQMEKEREYTAPLVGALIDIHENPNQVIFNEDLAKDPKAGKQMMEWEKTGKCWCYPRSHTFARGINIENRFVVIDEAQNFTHNELRKVLTRIHDDCKVIMIGHSGQCDLANPADSGFEDYIELFRNKPYAKVCTLTKNFRGELAQDADTIHTYLKEKVTEVNLQVVKAAS